MRYTTLGEGNAAKVLATDDYGPARTITTAPLGNAQALARALTAVHTTLEAALYPVAVHLDGVPVEGRRRLLHVFDAAACGRTSVTDGVWSRAESRAIAAGAAVHGLPAAVVAAARAEFGKHLQGYDGVLVPARVSSDAHRAGVLDLVISGALTRLGDDWWRSLEHTGFPLGEDDHCYPVGESTLDAPGELYDVILDLWDCQPADSRFQSTSIVDIEREGGDVHMPHLIVSARLLRAWHAHRTAR